MERVPKGQRIDIEALTGMIDGGNFRGALKLAKKYLNRADSRLAKGTLPPDELSTYIMVKFLEGDCYLRIQKPEKAIKSFKFLNEKIQFKKKESQFKGTILRKLAEGYLLMQDFRNGTLYLEQAVTSYFESKDFEEGEQLGISLLKILLSQGKEEESKRIGKTLLKNLKKIKKKELRQRLEAEINQILWQFETKSERKRKLLKFASKIKNDPNLRQELTIRAFLTEFIPEKDGKQFDQILQESIRNNQNRVLMDLMRVVMKNQMSWDELGFLTKDTRDLLIKKVKELSESNNIVEKVFYKNVKILLDGNESIDLNEEDLLQIYDTIRSLPKDSPFNPLITHIFLTTLLNLSQIPSVAILQNAIDLAIAEKNYCIASHLHLKLFKATKSQKDLEIFLKRLTKCKDEKMKRAIIQELSTMELDEKAFQKETIQKLKQIIHSFSS
ncbi:MAG: hypothetical protein D6732_01825 [Methanobacteriota archaeon]|nr:MAG: hypothetical protein D6732_01825 [Euryarchaeota archaeon]